MSTALTWYVARAGGLAAFALLTASVLLGVLLAGRPRLARWPRFALEDLHRFVGLLAWVFIGVHAGALLFDDYVPFSLPDLLVPLAAPYRPGSVALGVVATELLAALAITNWLRSRLPYAAWRRAHMLNFAVWALSLLHGVLAGSDSNTAWGSAYYAVAAGSVLGLATWRALRPVGGVEPTPAPRRERAPRPRPAAAPSAEAPRRAAVPFAPASAPAAYLGVAVAARDDLEVGVEVTAVAPESPAWYAGLRSSGDVVLAVDGTPVHWPGVISATVAARQPGAVLALRLLRDGAERDVRVVLAEAPSSVFTAARQGEPQGSQTLVP